MTVQLLKEENRRLRRRLRETTVALRDAEDTLDWVTEQLKGRVVVPVGRAHACQEG